MRGCNRGKWRLYPSGCGLFLHFIIAAIPWLFGCSGEISLDSQSVSPSVKRLLLNLSPHLIISSSSSSWPACAFICGLGFYSILPLGWFSTTGRTDQPGDYEYLTENEAQIKSDNSWGLSTIMRGYWTVPGNVSAIPAGDAYEWFSKWFKVRERVLFLGRPLGKWYGRWERNPPGR